jgi:hypothetical protein
VTGRTGGEGDRKSSGRWRGERRTRNGESVKGRHIIAYNREKREKIVL